MFREMESGNSVAFNVSLYMQGTTGSIKLNVLLFAVSARFFKYNIV